MLSLYPTPKPGGAFFNGAPMRVYFADSYVAYCEPTTGLQSFAVDFKDGFIDKRFVYARSRQDGVWTGLDIKDTTLSLVTLERPLAPCDTLLIYRDTPKDVVLVRYGFGGSVLQDESREVAARQSMHVLVELADAGKLTHEDCICGCAV